MKQLEWAYTVGEGGEELPEVAKRAQKNCNALSNKVGCFRMGGMFVAFSGFLPLTLGQLIPGSCSTPPGQVRVVRFLSLYPRIIC